LTTRLQLNRADLDRIYHQAESEYPAECCGILTVGAGGGPSRVHPCENIQGRLHQEDPAQYPRQPRIAYFIDPQEQFDIISAAQRSGGRVAGFYHSHIDCDAYFSAEDRERAMAWDEPAYADVVYLVASVYDAKARGHKAFGWQSESREFSEVEPELLD
jgi:proteasome lid subunit RPN8/RPN11